MIGFYLGGLLSMAVMTTGGAVSEGAPISIGDIVASVCWPVTIVVFLYDVVTGWRA